jgi:L-threonylcarbamoyladenylate synthase
MRETRLPNGIRVVSEELPALGSVTVGIWVENGSRYERPEEAGISHFLEHLFFKGTERRTAAQIAEEIDAVGGVLNAFTGKEYTCYYAKVLDEHLPLALDLLADVFTHSQFAEEEIERERTVIVQEISQIEDTPDDYVHDLFTQAFWPGPLTLVVARREGRVAPEATGGRDTVGIRVPDHPVALALLRAVDLPIAAPSANPFGRISPTCADHVRDQLGSQIDLILDGGPCRIGIESTVLQLSAAGPLLLRPGGTTLEEIEEVIGKVQVPAAVRALSPAREFVSPGMLPQHYAPRTALVIRMRETASLGDGELCSGKRVGLMAFCAGDQTSRFVQVEVLSDTGDLCEAAANFFAALRRLDAAGLDLIVAETFPEVGLGRALNDRLRRAAHS